MTVRPPKRSWDNLPERACECGGHPGCPGRFKPTHPRQKYAKQCRQQAARRCRRGPPRKRKGTSPAVAGALADVVLLVNGPKPPIPTQTGLAAALRTFRAAELGNDDELLRHAELQIAAWGVHRLIRRARGR